MLGQRLDFPKTVARMPDLHPNVETLNWNSHRPANSRARLLAQP
jgi:hypothetical protein